MGYALEKLPDWPAAMNRDEALEYTRLAGKLFGQLERNGSLTGKRIGRNGEVVFLREQLDAVTRRLFAAGLSDIDDEFEGVGGAG